MAGEYPSANYRVRLFRTDLMHHIFGIIQGPLLWITHSMALFGLALKLSWTLRSLTHGSVGKSGFSVET